MRIKHFNTSRDLPAVQLVEVYAESADEAITTEELFGDKLQKSGHAFLLCIGGLTIESKLSRGEC